MSSTNSSMLKAMLDASSSSVFLKSDIFNMIDRAEDQWAEDNKWVEVDESADKLPPMHRGAFAPRETLADRYPNLYEQVEVKQFTREELNSAIANAIDNLKSDFIYEMNDVAEFDVVHREISIDLPDAIFEALAEDITEDIFENQ